MNKNRRSMLKALGGIGTFALLDCGTPSGIKIGSDAGASGSSDGGSSTGGDLASPAGGDLGGSTATCVLDPNVTKGPYWVDTKLERSDVTTDTSGKASPNPRAVFAANAPYDTRGARDTRNAADNIYGGQTRLLVNLSGDTAKGYTATIALGVKVGTVFSC